MAQIAGQMQTGDGDGIRWLPCDGRLLRQQEYGDYLRRVGRAYGGGLALVRLPYRPGWSVCVADDPDAADPPGDSTTADPPTQVSITAISGPFYTPTLAATEAAVPVTGTVRPPGPVSASLVRDGAPLATTPLAVDDAGVIGSVINVPIGTGYSVRISSDDYPGATQDQGPFDVLQVLVSIAFDPISPDVPQGSYECFGLVTPADAPIDAALILWDGSVNEATVTVSEGGRFDLKVYLGPVGSPAYFLITPTDQPDRAAESTRFQIVQAITLDRVPEQSYVADSTATVELQVRGTFLGLEWETAEFCLVSDDIEGDYSELPLLRGQDPGDAFGLPVPVPPTDATLMFRVRKVQNPGVHTDSNAFRVDVTPGVEEPPPTETPPESGQR